MKPDELTLLFYLGAINNVDLAELMHRWNGTNAEYYRKNNYCIIENIMIGAAKDLTRSVDCREFFLIYIEEKHSIQNYRAIIGKEKYSKYTDEINAIIAAMHYIQISVFDEETLTTLKELKAEYIEELKNEN